MITCLLPIFLACSVSTDWTNRDERVYQRGIHVCKTRYNDGCIGRFFKYPNHHYVILCKQQEQETNEYNELLSEEANPSNCTEFRPKGD